jgi:hypothetical protein
MLAAASDINSTHTLGMSLSPDSAHPYDDRFQQFAKYGVGIAVNALAFNKHMYAYDNVDGAKPGGEQNGLGTGTMEQG